MSNINELSQAVDVALHMQIAGFYTIKKYSAGGELVEEYEFENLITDAGLNMLGNDSVWTGSGSTLFNSCYVGTGSTAPAVTDTALASFLAASSSKTGATNQNVTADGANYWYGRTHTYRFNAGVAAGNLTELGVGTSQTALFSRALIRDGSGTPTTITVLPDEFLDVTYQLRVYVPGGDATGTVVISGVTYDVVTRIADINTANYWAIAFNTKSGTQNVYVNPSYFVGGFANQTGVTNGVLGAVTGRPAGTLSNVADSTYRDPGVPAAYVAGSFRRDSVVTVRLGDGNLSPGIRSMLYHNGLGYWQTQFTPAIPKTASQVLTLNTRTSWGRVP